MSKIRELLAKEDTVVIFDIDGVLAAYEYGEYNHNACRDEEWNDFVLNNNVYEKARPIKVLQEYIKKQGRGKVFVCSVAGRHERTQKSNFVMNNYEVDESHIYFVNSKSEKLDILKEVKQEFPNLKDLNIVMVDDTSDVLTNIQENSGFSTAHISSFMD
ncbi:hypothetical protein [Lacrimispora amygdalina]|uniref:hypothetical protein n=1 Tax=Lacrimispora amygdalina TaxID=253257 RepID=UPI000BE4434F|nr:hypothetical protein [Lacrimispora amygdalina]